MNSDSEEQGSSAVGLLLLFWGGGTFAAAVGFLNSRWGWVVLAAGMVLLGLTCAMNNRSVRGSPLAMRVEFENWSPWSLRLNTLGCLLTVVGILMIWAQ